MSNPFAGVRWIWKNGQLIDFEKATVHVLSHALHYGSGVFEGIRCYNTLQGSAVFRLPEHIRRLENSAKVYRMPIAFTTDELIEACCETIRANELAVLLHPPDRLPRLRQYDRGQSAEATRSRCSSPAGPGASTWARRR